MIEKKKKIEIDEEFFKMIIETNKNLKNEILNLKKKMDEYAQIKEQRIIIPEIKTDKPGAFWCAELRFGIPKTPEETAELSQELNDFRKKLEELMRTYKIGQVNASILKEL